MLALKSIKQSITNQQSLDHWKNKETQFICSQDQN